jgi:hypothetical protein
MRPTDAKIRASLSKLLEGVDPDDINPELREAGMREVERILKEDNCVLELVLFLRCLRHLPAGAKPDYIESLRAAFFAGANAVYNRMPTKEEDFPVIVRIGEELQEFFDDLQQRNAINMPTAGSA